MLVVDSSIVAQALLDLGPTGRWAEGMLGQPDLMAPHLMPAEVTSVLRRAALRGRMSPRVATLAHGRLMTLPIELYPYGPLAARVWELRDAVTPYDAWYVALAESLDAPLATLDGRLARAAGPRCAFELFDPAQ